MAEEIKEEKKELKSGDVVCLKSDSSFKMTIGGFKKGSNENPICICYFIKDNQTEHREIPRVALEFVEERPHVTTFSL